MSNTGIVGRTRYLGVGAAGSQPERLANHEQAHIRQIERIVNTLQIERGSGDVLAGTGFLNLIYVVPERWREGIGGRLLDTLLAEAKRRGSHHMYLWTHEHQNERAHRLYRSRSFAPTRRTMHDGEGQLIGEWRFVCEQP